MRNSLVLLVLVLINPFSVNAKTLVERQKEFNSILKKANTPEAKIKKAEELAKNKKSQLRIDAINYLIEQRSLSSGPVFTALVKDDDMREFAIFGVGELRIQEATPRVIHALKDDNHNIRGNAFRALQKMYPKDFNFAFHYDDAPNIRATAVKNIEKWWKENRERLKATSFKDMSPKEKQEAELRWEAYGRGYLDRPN